MGYFEIKTVIIAEKRQVCIPVSRPTGISYATNIGSKIRTLVLYNENNLVTHTWM
jgi:hypothetical protein